MNAVGSVSASAIARDLNKFVVGRGGEAIPGLEGMDPKKLLQLRDQLNGFADQFERNAAQSANIAQLADAQAINAFRELARLASEKAVVAASAQGALKGGMCGPQQQPQVPEDFVPGPENRGRSFQPFIAGPLSTNGSNFNPLGANAIAPATSMASACAVGGCGVAAAALARGPDASFKALQQGGSGSAFFEDRVFAAMIKIVADMQQKIEKRLEKLQQEAEAAEKKGKKKGKGGIGGFLGGIVKVAAPIVGTALGGPVGGMIGNAVGNAVGGAMSGSGGGGGGGGGDRGAESRNIEFEKIKFDMQKLSQMQQALSNILNSMDELAKSAIRHIKSG